MPAAVKAKEINDARSTAVCKPFSRISHEYEANGEALLAAMETPNWLRNGASPLADDVSRRRGARGHNSARPRGNGAVMLKTEAEPWARCILPTARSLIRSCTAFLATSEPDHRQDPRRPAAGRAVRVRAAPPPTRRRLRQRRAGMGYGQLCGHAENKALLPRASTTKPDILRLRAGGRQPEYGTLEFAWRLCRCMRRVSFARARIEL